MEAYDAAAAGARMVGEVERFDGSSRMGGCGATCTLLALVLDLVVPSEEGILQFKIGVWTVSLRRVVLYHVYRLFRRLVVAVTFVASQRRRSERVSYWLAICLCVVLML